MKKNHGITLIELMIALTISGLIISVIATVYLAAVKNSQRQYDLNHIKENAGVIINLLTADIRLAGYIGCAKLTDDFPIKNYQSVMMSQSNKIHSEKLNSITVRHANIFHANVVIQENSSLLYSTKVPIFHEKDILLISDCKKAELFSVKNISRNNDKQKMITTEPLIYQYDQDAEISRLENNTYFVKKTRRRTIQGDPIYALYMTDIGKNTVELVEGMDEIKVQYTLFDQGMFFDKDLITDASNLKGVGLSFTLSSMDKVYQHKWHAYVALRNQ